MSFPHLLRQEVGVYADGVTDRVVLEGPDVELPSQLAVPLGMTIHELTTNAFRHGALSTANGRVTVRWTVMPAKDKRVLTCHWIEAEGPPVVGAGQARLRVHDPDPRPGPTDRRQGHLRATRPKASS